MSTKELAESLEPSIPQEEIDAASKDQEQQTEEVTQEQPEQKAEEHKEPEGEEKHEKPPKGFVPQGALHEERARRKELQQEIARIQQAQEHQRQLLEQRFAQMQQAWQQQNAPKPPDFNDDPVGAMRFEQEQHRQALAQLTGAQQQEYQRRQEEYQRQQYFGQLQSAVSQAEAEYSAENPDYLESVKFLKSQRAAQLEALGMPSNEIIGYVQNEAAQIAESALRGGRNPAEVAHKMALAAGYKKAQAAPDGQQKIETMQKGMKASQSLGSGGAPPTKGSVEWLANASEDEFNEFMSSGGWNKLG